VEKTIYNSKFRIVGVLDQTGTGLDNALFMDKENLDDIIGSGNSPLRKGQISIIFTKIAGGLDPYQVGKRVEGEIVEVDVVARNDMGKEMLRTLKDINRIFLVSFIMTSILAVFLVWAIFSAIANERAREVGIMRAVGAKQSHIVRLFLLEIVLMGMAGSIAGVVSGTWLSVSLAHGFTLLRNISTDLTLIQRTAIAAAGFAAGTGICLSGALMPVNRLKKLEPLMAIKKE
jgi:putative ABC transport system permease protein